LESFLKRGRQGIARTHRQVGRKGVARKEKKGIQETPEGNRVSIKKIKEKVRYMVKTVKMILKIIEQD